MKLRVRLKCQDEMQNRADSLIIFGCFMFSKRSKFSFLLGRHPLNLFFKFQFSTPSPVFI